MEGVKFSHDENKASKFLCVFETDSFDFQQTQSEALLVSSLILHLALASWISPSDLASRLCISPSDLGSRISRARYEIRGRDPRCEGEMRDDTNKAS